VHSQVKTRLEYMNNTVGVLKRQELLILRFTLGFWEGSMLLVILGICVCGLFDPCFLHSLFFVCLFIFCCFWLARETIVSPLRETILLKGPLDVVVMIV
jgi:hypothetical protein